MEESVPVLCDLVGVRRKKREEDLNTHLPPRKRLLAGFRTAAALPCCDAEPVPASPTLISADVAARLRGMMGTVPSSPEEIVQAARSAASAAAAAAAAARAAAVDKAAVAAKARAAARAAMEFLDSVSRAGVASRNGIQLKAKSKKKHVKVKLLYNPNGRIREGNGTMVEDAPKPRRRKESDEEVARKLHRAMNSSPRISFTGPKRPRSVCAGKDGCPSEVGSEACNGSLTHAAIGVGGLINEFSVGKSSERSVQFSKIKGPDDGEDSSRNAAKSRDISDNGVGVGTLDAVRKVKIKRKQLFLNHHSSKETEEPKETEPSIDSIGYYESKSKGTEKRASPADAKAPDDDPVPIKITSVWKFKKFKTSHCSPDNKMLHNVCSSTSAAETSASVKAD